MRAIEAILFFPFPVFLYVGAYAMLWFQWGKKGFFCSRSLCIDGTFVFNPITCHMFDVRTNIHINISFKHAKRISLSASRTTVAFSHRIFIPQAVHPHVKLVFLAADDAFRHVFRKNVRNNFRCFQLRIWQQFANCLIFWYVFGENEIGCRCNNRWWEQKQAFTNPKYVIPNDSSLLNSNMSIF